MTRNACPTLVQLGLL